MAFDATGLDQVEFLICANPGEPLKPLAQVASGGETSRLMLALKTALAQADATPTLIFDEIDLGIGGRVGGVVGQKLWRLTGTGTPVQGRRTGTPAKGAPAKQDNQQGHKVSTRCSALLICPSWPLSATFTMLGQQAGV